MCLAPGPASDSALRKRITRVCVKSATGALVGPSPPPESCDATTYNQEYSTERTEMACNVDLINSSDRSLSPAGQRNVLCNDAPVLDAHVWVGGLSSNCHKWAARSLSRRLAMLQRTRKAIPYATENTGARCDFGCWLFVLLLSLACCVVCCCCCLLC